MACRIDLSIENEHTLARSEFHISSAFYENSAARRVACAGDGGEIAGIGAGLICPAGGEHEEGRAKDWQCLG